MKIFATVFALFILWSCNSESRANPRAYVEGKITGTGLDYRKITVKLSSGSTNVAETIPDNAGDFTLSGPLTADSFSVAVNKKISSFSSSKPGCYIAADSLQIVVPAGISYIIFNDIKLK
ncbi:hypothetical protein [Kaistella palustris]|uniref:hypothetical protein n=1 Tax=Kaistella palustris TaxID=493376 RepID=UPI00040AA403|nr:hypothetical protein [Kaistella palustris]